jgi:hypothetical protein
VRYTRGRQNTVRGRSAEGPRLYVIGAANDELTFGFDAFLMSANWLMELSLHLF